MNKNLLGLFFCVLLLAGCVRPQPQEEFVPVYTQAALTVAARLTENPPVEPPTPLPVTDTPGITATTESPLQTATSALTNTPLPPDCDQAEFLADLTVPDGTSFVPGQGFTKKWQLKNVGSCAWTSAYKFILVDFKGAPMVSPDQAEVPVSSTVAPGGIFDLAIDMTAPAVSGEYTGYWGLVNAAGERVPIQGTAGDAFYVQIEVAQSTTGFDVVIDSVSVSCQPDTYIVTATLTANGAGVVAYTWDNNIIQTPPPLFITFDSPGSQIVNYEIQAAFVDPNTAWIDLRILEPGNFNFGHVSLKCP